jgi:hypothetical protein
VRSDVQVPDFMPILGRGKHRGGGARGGCFMEFASYLAGERWSDHPRCTQPLLAAAARAVNDCTSDAGRARLVPLIPSVVGLTSKDVRVDVAIALRCSRTALPVVSAEWAHVMAVAVLTTERFLAQLDGRAENEVSPLSRSALNAAPGAERWARDFLQRVGPVEIRQYGTSVGACSVRQAVIAVAQSSVPDRDRVLYDMLAGAIADCTALITSDLMVSDHSGSAESQQLSLQH